MSEQTTSQDAYARVKALIAAGEFDAARRLAASAMAAFPADARFPWGLSFLDRKEGRPADALRNIVTALELNWRDFAYWSDFWACLAATPPPNRDPGFIRVLARALKLDGMDRTPAEVEAQLQLSMKFQALREAGAPLNWALANHAAGSYDAAARDLLLTHFEHGATTQREMEAAITALRRDMLQALRQPVAAAAVFLDLASTLAMHCAYHEYVFAETAAETALLAELERDIASDIRPDTNAVAMLAAYRPLWRLADAAQIPKQTDASSPKFSRLLHRQIYEPAEEQQLKEHIPSLTQITDPTSRDVRAQYEENPYPRWQYLPAQPLKTKHEPERRERILVAGCGTGRHPLIFAANSPTKEIWAVDLSLASLAYGKRKAAAYGLGNVKFFHGDILRLGDLGIGFDEISCEGVLHHLRAPEMGLKALRALLTDNGVLKIAMYAATSRHAITAGIRLREELKLSPTIHDIRKFREAVISRPGAPAAGLAMFRDFYFTSECRDLAFHVQEHQYTLPQLAELVTQVGLTLERLYVPDNMLPLFHKRFPDTNPATAWTAWAEIEADHPGVFGPMYRLILRKAR